MSDGNTQEAQSLYVRQCIIHAFLTLMKTTVVKSRARMPSISLLRGLGL